jgi:hypothetical protein
MFLRHEYNQTIYFNNTAQLSTMAPDHMDFQDGSPSPPHGSISGLVIHKNLIFYGCVAGLEFITPHQF